MVDIKAFATKHKWTYLALIVGGVSIGWVVYRRHEGEPVNPFASSSSATAAAGTVTDPQTGSTYSDTATDPETGETFASEISQYGSVAAAQSALMSINAGTAATNNPSTLATGYVSDQSTSGITTSSGQNLYQSNSAWAQAVQAGLEDVSGTTTYNGVDIGVTLGKYLQGEPLTNAEAALIGTARAEYGPPPVGNLQIITVPAATTNPASSAPAPTTKPTQPYPAPSGLTVKHTGAGMPAVYLVSWNLIKGTSATGPTPTSYTVDVTTTAYKQVSQQTVSVPDNAGNKTSSATISIAKTGTYIVRVWANGTTGIGPKSASYTLKVT